MASITDGNAWAALWEGGDSDIGGEDNDIRVVDGS